MTNFNGGVGMAYSYEDVNGTKVIKNGDVIARRVPTKVPATVVKICYPEDKTYLIFFPMSGHGLGDR